MVLTVTDATGKQVRQLDASNKAGLHRTPWDLREQAPAGRGGRGQGRGGGQTAPPTPPVEGGAEATPAPPRRSWRTRRRGRGRSRRWGAADAGSAAAVPLVRPGSYTVTLGRLVRGAVTPRSAPADCPEVEAVRKVVSGSPIQPGEDCGAQGARAAAERCSRTFRA